MSSTEANPPITTTGPVVATEEASHPNKQALAGLAETNRNVDADCLFIIKLILAFVFPPLAVALERGCDGQTVLNIILTIIGWIPGVIHALFIILHCGKDVADDGTIAVAETTNGNAANV